MMKEVLNRIHSAVDENIELPALFALYVDGTVYEELKYFAADVIASCCDDEHAEGLACACQCFLNSRIMHNGDGEITPLHVLMGDYFVGQIPGFELPGDLAVILDLFAQFVIKETADAEELPGCHDIRNDLDRYEALFRKVAEVAYE